MTWLNATHIKYRLFSSSSHRQLQPDCGTTFCVHAHFWYASVVNNNNLKEREKKYIQNYAFAHKVAAFVVVVVVAECMSWNNE